MYNCSNCGVKTKKKNKDRKNVFCGKICYLSYIRTKDRVNLKCDGCGNMFTRIKSECRDGKLNYCSNKCRPRSHGLKTYNCLTCNSEVKRYFSLVVKNKNVFCNNSCSAIWSNKNRNQSTTSRSKLEKWLEEKLKSEFTDLFFLFNNTTNIGMELDIYIPTLKLAFEINGIFHYEDIFNNGLLTIRQKLDEKKKQLCLSNGILLIEVNTMEQKNFTEKSSLKYLDMITEKIKQLQNYGKGG